jgi:uncharacterized damage-inducible protein DinB
MPTGSESQLPSLVCRTFSARYQEVKSRVHALVDPLGDEELWKRPFPFGSSIGHLLLHLTGNLNYYIGALIQGSGYARDRPTEFTDASRPPKQAVLDGFDAAVDVVLATLAAQSESDWSLPYSAVGEEDAGNRLTILLRCAGHADHHLGQMVYLRKQLALETRPGP